MTHHNQLIALKSFGSVIPACDSEQAVTPATLFDVASLTKPIATTTTAALLYERGVLELDAPIIGVIPEFLVDSCGEPDPRRPEITFRMLLAHSSGLPAYEKLFLNAHSREDLLVAAFTMPSRPILPPAPNTATSGSSFWARLSNASPENPLTSSANAKSLALSL